jgi:hypothetical protein
VLEWLSQSNLEGLPVVLVQSAVKAKQQIFGFQAKAEVKSSNVCCTNINGTKHCKKAEVKSSNVCHTNIKGKKHCNTLQAKLGLKPVAQQCW